VQNTINDALIASSTKSAKSLSNIGTLRVPSIYLCKRKAGRLKPVIYWKKPACFLFYAVRKNLSNKKVIVCTTDGAAISATSQLNIEIENIGMAAPLFPMKYKGFEREMLPVYRPLCIADKELKCYGLLYPQH